MKILSLNITTFTRTALRCSFMKILSFNNTTFTGAIPDVLSLKTISPHQYHCCGALTFSQWRDSRWLQEGQGINNTVPDSCCKTPSPYCGVSDHPSNIWYNVSTLAFRFLFALRNLGISVAVEVGFVSRGLCPWMGESLREYGDECYRELVSLEDNFTRSWSGFLL